MAESIAPVTVSSAWVDLYDATGIDAGAPLVIYCEAGADVRLAVSESEPTTDVAALELSAGQDATLDGSQSGLWAKSSGGSSVLLVQENEGALRKRPFFDTRVIDGIKAITVQPFTELNVKRGLQYYIRASWPDGSEIGSGTSRKIRFQTGAKQVLIKLRVFDYIAEELSITIYSSPTGVTGGTSLPVRNWNAVSPVTSTVTVTNGVSTSSDGTAIGEAEYYFGSASQGQRVQSSIPEGIERVIAANSDFIINITNTGSGNARAQYFLTWYEGVIGTQVP